mmetsp:Transcript_19020/g.22449  ORF Transcript_19020/g.22449 Transcript_19020/m.22449 type:complete len:89 (+) Transcript_19020:151-417(+)
MYILGVMVPLHGLLCHIFIYEMGKGVEGVAFATTISQFGMMMAIEYHCNKSPSMQKTYPGFWPDRRAFENMGAFLKVTVPGAFLQSFR